jgi:predicted MFS family arabinose efflux permease
VLAFLILLYAYLLSQFFRAFLAIVSVELGPDIGLDASQLGQVSAIWFAVFALAQFPVGVALDRFGPRRTISLFMLCAVLGAGLFAIAQTYAACLLAMALIGAGCAPVLMAGLYFFGRTEPPGRFAMMASLLIGLGTLGNIMGAAPLAYAVAAFGWRASMAGIAALTALSCVLTYALLRDPPAVARAHGSSGGLVEGLRELFAMRALWFLAPLVTLSYAVIIAVRSLWIAPFFGQVHDYDAVQRGNAALVMAIAMSAGALAYGPLERWVGSPKATTMAGSIVTGIAFLALGLWGDVTPGVALALLAVIGWAGMTYGILMAHARLFFPAHLLGRGVTFVNFLFIAGGGVLQALSGPFVQARTEAGAPPAETFGELHLMFGALLLAATAVYALTPARPVQKVT